MGTVHLEDAALCEAALKEYYSENRIWQGIPGIAITKNGRIFSTFYSGGIKETIGNFVLLKYYII